MQKKTIDNSIAEICEQLKKANKIAVFCHTRPDGDAIGAGVALTRVLKSEGTFAVFCCDCEVPEKYAFSLRSDVLTRLPSSIAFDTFIAVDSSDVNRLGMFASIFATFDGVKINIDHHFSNKRFADYNLVVDCPATCQLMTEIFSFAGFEIDEQTANLLMMGLMADSGNFTHADISDRSFEIAALLRKRGADVAKLNNKMSTQSRQRALLFGKVMANMRFALDDVLAYIVIPMNCFAGVPDYSLTEGFVDFPLTVDGVEVSVSLLEVAKNKYKVSFRSKGKINVNTIAATFGGGGHVLASGCMLFGTEGEVVEKMVNAVYKNL